MSRLPRYLALDIANRTGWAVSEGQKIVASGVRDFSLRSHEHNGHRGVRFYNFLLTAGRVDEIFYEKVQFSGGGKTNFRSSDGGELYKGFLMLVNMYAASFSTFATGVHPNTLKKAFTGNGHATKELMCAKAREYGWKGGVEGTALLDDEADAIALLVTQIREKYGLEVSF